MSTEPAYLKEPDLPAPTLLSALRWLTVTLGCSRRERARRFLALVLPHETYRTTRTSKSEIEDSWASRRQEQIQRHMEGPEVQTNRNLAAPEQRGGYSTRLLQGGTEPDPRFTLANERTFLAWIRTSLALLAGGVAVEAFMATLFGPELRKTLAVLLLVLALFLSGGSFFRWLNVERAMRQKAPLPLPWIAPLLAAGGALVAAAMIIFILARQN